MPHKAPTPTPTRLDWSLGLLALCLTLAIGAAMALWSLQQLHIATERDARQDAQAMAQSVAETLALQISRAVRLGIPLADIPGIPAYLARALAGAPGLASIAVHTASGDTLHSTPARPLMQPVSAAIQVQGKEVGRVVVDTAPAALTEHLHRAYALSALLVLALGLLSGWLAARGPGQRLERQRQQLQAGLNGATLPAATATDATLPDPSHGGMARALHALAAGQQQMQEQEAAVQAYAQELLAVDFDQRLQAPVARIVAGAAPATPLPAPLPADT